MKKINNEQLSLSTAISAIDEKKAVKTATKKNSVDKQCQKVNTHFGHDVVTVAFKNAAAMAKYDTAIYIGACGTVKKVNCFSVNFKKYIANIYCDNTCFDILFKMSNKFKNSEFLKMANAVDKIRPNKIITTNINDIELMLVELKKVNAIVGIA